MMDDQVDRTESNKLDHLRTWEKAIFVGYAKAHHGSAAARRVEQQELHPMTSYLEAENLHSYFEPEDYPQSYMVTKIKTIDDKPHTHIWMCGTLSGFRRKGVFKKNLQKLVDAPDTTDVITVTTSETRFPEMFAIITKLGFREVSTSDNFTTFEISKKDLRIAAFK